MTEGSGWGMANVLEQRIALNAFPDLPWSACLRLAFEVDLMYCTWLTQVGGTYTPHYKKADSIFPYAQQTLLVGAYVSVYMC